MIECENCKRLEKIIERLRNEMQKEIDELKAKVAMLEAKLAQYENPHTPPSKRMFPPNKTNNSNGKPGRKEGHEGVTRERPEPTHFAEATKDRCPHCSAKLGEPFHTERKIIEEIPEPQPMKIIEFGINHYICPSCGKEVVGEHPELPREGNFGKNALAHVTLMKYEDRLPFRKIQATLQRQFGLNVSPGAIFDFTRRASNGVMSVYEFILNRVREADVVYVDETGAKVDGTNYWLWVFTTPTETFVVVRNSRGTKVLREVLTRRFRGIIVCDGWRSYPSFTKKLQRCWAHMLRESKDLAEKIKEIHPLNNALHRLYEKFTTFLSVKRTHRERKKLWYEARATLRRWLRRHYQSKEIRAFIEKVQNGFDYWFTFILHPDVEPTNNRAERALREHVVQRKIFGTLRNEKGARIYETLMTVIATWKQQGLPLHQKLVSYL